MILVEKGFDELPCRIRLYLINKKKYWINTGKIRPKCLNFKAPFMKSIISGSQHFQKTVYEFLIVVGCILSRNPVATLSCDPSATLIFEMSGVNNEEKLTIRVTISRIRGNWYFFFQRNMKKNCLSEILWQDMLSTTS